LGGEKKESRDYRKKKGDNPQLEKKNLSTPKSGGKGGRLLGKGGGGSRGPKSARGCQKVKRNLQSRKIYQLSLEGGGRERGHVAKKKENNANLKNRKAGCLTFYQTKGKKKKTQPCKKEKRRGHKKEKKRPVL